MAQADERSVVVYQAFRPEIAEEAVTLGRFGPTFSRSRMSWVKPNFLWMMYRSGWATKEGQERILAVRLTTSFFERVLRAAVPSSFPHDGSTREEWAAALQRSEVRLQWDPDHDPSGRPLERRAIQLGLRGRMLEEYASDAILELSDVTPFVTEQRANATAPYGSLLTPAERAYTPAAPRAATAVGLSSLRA